MGTIGTRATLPLTPIPHASIAAWVALGSTPAPSVAKLVARSVTSGNTSTITVYESPDGGTTWSVALRGDTGQEAKAVPLAVGTTYPTAGSAFTASLWLQLAADTTHVMVKETTAGATNDFVYELHGL